VLMVVGGKFNEHDCGHIDSNQSQKIINDCANGNGSIMDQFEKGKCPGESWKLPVDEIMCLSNHKPGKQRNLLFR